MKKAILPASLFCLVLFAQSAYALDMEYYTYNGFDAVVPAFQKVALIFGDSNYQSLLFCVLTAAFAFGALAVHREPNPQGRGVELLGGAVRIRWHSTSGQQCQLGELPADNDTSSGRDIDSPQGRYAWCRWSARHRPWSISDCPGKAGCRKPAPAWHRGAPRFPPR